MHHGTCVKHVPWCMSGLLTRGGGEDVPGIPGACAPAILRIWQEAHWMYSLIHFLNSMMVWQISVLLVREVLANKLRSRDVKLSHLTTDMTCYNFDGVIDLNCQVHTNVNWQKIWIDIRFVNWYTICPCTIVIYDEAHLDWFVIACVCYKSSNFIMDRYISTILITEHWWHWCAMDRKCLNVCNQISRQVYLLHSVPIAFMVMHNWAAGWYAPYWQKCCLKTWKRFVDTVIQIPYS